MPPYPRAEDMPAEFNTLILTRYHKALQMWIKSGERLDAEKSAMNRGCSSSSSSSPQLELARAANTSLDVVKKNQDIFNRIQQAINEQCNRGGPFYRQHPKINYEGRWYDNGKSFRCIEYVISTLRVENHLI